jgi:hypothetical protein
MHWYLNLMGIIITITIIYYLHIMHNQDFWHIPWCRQHCTLLGCYAAYIDSWNQQPLMMGLIGCPKNSVDNYQYMLYNIAEGQRLHIMRNSFILLDNVIII